MKALQVKIIPAALTALFLGSYAWVPAIAAPTEQQPGAAAPAPTSEKAGEACAKLDKDLDGYLSVAEWKALKNAKAFKSADANQDGKLDLMECAKALGN